MSNDQDKTARYLNIIVNKFRDTFLEDHEKFIELFGIIVNEYPDQELDISKDMHYHSIDASAHHKALYLEAAGQQIGIIYVKDNNLLICADDKVEIGPKGKEVTVHRYGEITFRELLKGLFIKDYKNISSRDEKRDALDTAHRQAEKIALMIS